MKKIIIGLVIFSLFVLTGCGKPTTSGGGGGGSGSNYIPPPTTKAVVVEKMTDIAGEYGSITTDGGGSTNAVPVALDSAYYMMIPDVSTQPDAVVLVAADDTEISLHDIERRLSIGFNNFVAFDEFVYDNGNLYIATIPLYFAAIENNGGVAKIKIDSEERAFLVDIAKNIPMQRGAIGVGNGTGFAYIVENSDINTENDNVIINLSMADMEDIANPMISIELPGKNTDSIVLTKRITDGAAISYGTTDLVDKLVGSNVPQAFVQDNAYGMYLYTYGMDKTQRVPRTFNITMYELGTGDYFQMFKINITE